MRQLNRLMVSVSAALAAALMTALPGTSLAQGANSVEPLEHGDETEDEINCIVEVDCLDLDEEDTAQEAGTDDTAPGSAPAGSEDASGEPELITPGSTPESNPGGSTRPGTTPDT